MTTSDNTDSTARQLSKMITPGQAVVITLEQGELDVTVLKDSLADFGIGSVSLTEADVQRMDEATLMDKLDDIRLADKVLLMVGYASKVYSDVAGTVHKHFVRNDGKAVFIIIGEVQAP